MFAMDQNKTQEERVLTPEDAEAGVIVSPDTSAAESCNLQGRAGPRNGPFWMRAARLRSRWSGGGFRSAGWWAHPAEWTWQEFQQLQR